MNIKNLVGPIYVINLDERTDRWAECEIEFRKLDIDINEVNRFSAIRAGIHGLIGCAFSHAQALSRFLIESNAPHCMILEDDFHIIPDAASLYNGIDNFMTKEKKWDVLLLSGNEITAIPCEDPGYVNVVPGVRHFRPVFAQVEGVCPI
jgi:GR25 family glycosyltransferase involved in LPS biosynthesis